MSALKQVLNSDHGVTTLILPMIAKNTSEFPRFRRSYLTRDVRTNVTLVAVVCKVAANDQVSIATLQAIPGFISMHAMPGEPSLRVANYEIAAQWKTTFEAITSFQPHKVGRDYVDLLKEVYEPEIFARLKLSFGW